MALEPITRQEQIIAGKDLKPITRMEKFLKEYGGGGGNSAPADWNASEGEPGHIKNRTHYEEVKEVIGDTLTWDGNTDGLVTDSSVGIYYKVSDAVLTMDDCSKGINTTVMLNGSVMTLTEYYVGDDGIIDMGDGAAVYAPYDNYNYYDEYIFPERGLYFVSVQNDDFSSVVQSVTIPDYTGFKSVQTVVKTIDPKYLPKIEKFYINGDKYLYRDVNCTTKASVDDIPDSCAIEIGRSVFFESAGTEKVIEWYNPVWVTSYYESFNRGYRTVAVIDEDGNCIKAYTAEYTPSAPT